MFLNNYRNKIEADFAARFKLLLPDNESYFRQIQEQIQNKSDNEQVALKYLYAYMPVSDIYNYDFTCFYDCAKTAVTVWEKSAEVRELPDEIFMQYVLFLRVNEEELRPCRWLFMTELDKFLQNKDGLARIIDVNYWCAGEITYKSTDERTLSALATFERGYGRCGEESNFLVHAYRSIGIPARQVYAPRWSHCDDNHAWVEIYYQGQWYFTGAAEPAPILNLGWFNNASSRAMLIHSRYFPDAGYVKEPTLEVDKKEVEATADLVGIDSVRLLNQLDRYALTHEVEIKVEDFDGTPVPNALIGVSVLNYSSYENIAWLQADDTGLAKLRTGLGTVHLDVKHNGRYGTAIFDTVQSKSCTLVLAKTLSDFIQSVNSSDLADGKNLKISKFSAPQDSLINCDKPSKEEIARSDSRLVDLVQHRMDKINGYKNETWLKLDALITNEADKSKIKDLIDVISVKDRTDIDFKSAEDHWRNSPNYDGSMPKDIWQNYLLNPRVDFEPLSPYREFILSFFSAEKLTEFKDNPPSVWKYIDQNIRQPKTNFVDKLITLPSAVLKFGHAGDLSKKILAVAIWRSIGIPARLDPMQGSLQYWDGSEFMYLHSPKMCPLKITCETAEKWIYNQNWTLARIYPESGLPDKVINLGGEQWLNNQIYLQLQSGLYRLVVAQRLPNGNQYTYCKYFDLTKDEDSADIKEAYQLYLTDILIGDDEMLVNFPLPNVEFKQISTEQEPGCNISVSDLIKEGRRIFVWLEAGREPTEHILNEIQERRSDFAEVADSIVFCLSEVTALEDSNINRALTEFPTIKCVLDEQFYNVETVGRRMYVDFSRLPLLVVADDDANGVYATSGYNVGSANMLLRILNILSD